MMAIEEKLGKTLVELGVGDASGVEALIAEIIDAMNAERQALTNPAPRDPVQWERAAKELRDRWLARKNGILSQIDANWLKSAPRDLKPSVGREYNRLREMVTEVMHTDALVRDMSLSTSVDDVIDEARVSIDLTLPGYRRPLGSIHPVTRVQREIEDIFLGLGFTIETGPEIESVYYNFNALNIPESHPARDDWDTIYVDPNTVLRTHTSPVQMRAMEKHGAPLYVIAPGKCYRRDNPDSTHSPMFHQLEGLAVDTDITFADLRGTLDFFAKKFFGEKVRTRFTPSFFPFTEPSGEVAVSCPFCEGKGCRRCKGSGWIELLGCGMVHPEVLRHGGIDPERYSGWAFGLGIDRFAMVKYDINDIQLFFQGDIRFLEQF
jgi:phenylalanyl-tRNA synthetase alpha chain